ncbi:hypothetical protein CFP71_15990 [Amycolatopsis thailandensis]|uniref:UDP-N-acetylglucosamine kinase n=1 Tax=Amycolatopsis thailandensis TaxID=589330 RepID=A0A229SAU1_9PSEU|nr:hypothetical protein [Amycolatopsis thailandensis]OXM55980.1 hypothetical protein CFP71_15990 [Amycolatopsis thailandensis]
MPRLIVLNGPPACGKSTLARLYAENHPLTLNLDIDRIRGLLGAWRDDAAKAGVLARELAMSAARTHVLRRFAERTRAAAEPEHVEAHEMLGGPGQLAAMYDRLVELVSTRPKAAVVRTRDGLVRQAYEGLLEQLA